MLSWRLPWRGCCVKAADACAVRERIYAPLAAGLLQPYRADSKLKVHKRTQLDRLYQKVLDDLEELIDAVVFRATVFRGNGAGSATHYFERTGAWGTG
jgi:hypothetical protein